MARPHTNHTGKLNSFSRRSLFWLLHSWLVSCRPPESQRNKRNGRTICYLHRVWSGTSLFVATSKDQNFRLYFQLDQSDMGRGEDRNAPQNCNILILKCNDGMQMVIFEEYNLLTLSQSLLSTWRSLVSPGQDETTARFANKIKHLVVYRQIINISHHRALIIPIIPGD